MFCHCTAVLSVPLVVVAAVIPLAVSRIKVVAARNTSTTTIIMSTMARLTGTATRHRDIAATAQDHSRREEHTDNDNAQVDTNTVASLTGMAVVANIVAEMKYKGFLM